MLYPRLLGVSLRVTSFFGQAMVQRPHPLQRASSICICGIAIPLHIENQTFYQIFPLYVKKVQPFTAFAGRPVNRAELAFAVGLLYDA
jgi:hypothetical protein